MAGRAISASNLPTGEDTIWEYGRSCMIVDPIYIAHRKAMYL